MAEDKNDHASPSSEAQEIEDKQAFQAPRIISKPDQETEIPIEKPQVQEEAPPVITKPSGPQIKRLVAVSFHTAGKIFDFECEKLDLKPGDQVIVDTEEGLGFASVVIGPRKEDIQSFDKPLKKIIRKTTYEDMRQHEKNTDREKMAMKACQEKIRQYNLDMKLVNVEYLHSGAKAIFFFTSEERVDFRQLVRELAQQFHTRIEMRQIGPRDETKMMGGIGVCGRELCCSTWLRNFDPISIKMAKEQDLSLNPSKLAGQCGRLKCCLAYEYETYRDAKRGLPKLGRNVCWKNGDPCGKVIGHNIFDGSIRVHTDDGSEQFVRLDEVQVAKSKPQKQEKNEVEKANDE